MLRVKLLVIAICSLASGALDSDSTERNFADVTPVSDSELGDRLKVIAAEHKLPGLVAGIVQGKTLVAVGAAGVRKSGSKELITVNDKMHLGSCAKAMTATRIAMIVEAGKLSWDSTLASVFPDKSAEIHPDFQQVTLTQLLTHRASLPANGPWNQLGKNLSTPEQRLVLIRKVLGKGPRTKPGTHYEYSNVGYVLAAAMAERVTGESWEDLMRDGLFEPLEMTSAGFGSPGSKGSVDQPWGHRSFLGFQSASLHDNPPAMGPAGTVHASIPDWAKFAVLHLQAARGQASILKGETFLRLQTPPENANYAMGWIVVAPVGIKDRVLAHDGSNTLWYSSIWILPDRNLALLVATNCAEPSAQKGCQETVQSLLNYYETVLSRRN